MSLEVLGREGLVTGVSGDEDEGFMKYFVYFLNISYHKEEFPMFQIITMQMLIMKRVDWIPILSPWLSVMKPRCLRPWVGNPENFSFNTFENSVKPYLWIRGTELPRTESREGRKKASAAVCTMSRLAPRSRT